MEPYTYEFTAIRGVQAGTAYYVAMCPLKLIPRLFRFDDETLPADLRAQRLLNRARVPAIARYIADNPKEYILSSLCASVDGDLDFEPLAGDGPLRSVGRLRIAMTATILINDGQHRRAAIEEALRDRPYLGDETISVVVFADRGLLRSQQMFADLNIHAVKPTKSIGVLYDHRDPMSRLVRRVVSAVPLFRDFTEREKTTISNRSLKLFTLSAIYQATAEFIGKPKGADLTQADEEHSVRFWNAVAKAMPDWQSVAQRRIAAADLRRDYVHAHGIALQAIAIAGAQLVALYPEAWDTRLEALRQLDWSRSNVDLWEGRALIGGRVNKARTNVILVSNIILQHFGLPLTTEGERLERMHTCDASEVMVNA
ncbi:MAG TPA: DNA sulfur modification protein DndB [Gemmatimonadaceae bacterium]|nr:DNA sulfur modification protein DndB [Gemmatimonadaceae bacterium]